MQETRFINNSELYMNNTHHARIAVLIPCYNEEVTIGKVVSDFRRALPDASIYVYDNNSSDKTAEIARMPEQSFVMNRVRAREMCVGKCFETSMPIATLW